MRKRLTLLIFLMMLFSINASALFPGYDFTFFKSIEDTLAVMNNERFGFDYSGYGYVGESMTTGVYLRIGVQMPYAIFINRGSTEETAEQETTTSTAPADTTTTEEETLSTTLTLESDAKDESSADASKKTNKNKTLDYKFALSIGPAFRKFIGDQAQWYMGIGFTSTIEGINSGSELVSTSQMNIKIGAEFDMGFRIDASKKKNTSLRIGIYGKVDLLTFTSISKTSKDSSSSEMSLIADIFTPIGEKRATHTVGYVSLGHTFKSNERETRYRYTTKYRALNKGITTEI